MRRITDLFSLTAILGFPVLLALTLPLVAVPQAAQAAGDSPGKAVFMAQKCNVCHTVESQAIERTTKTSKAPDLSNAGAAPHDAAWLTKFLKKEIAAESGKKHSKEWKGNDADMKTLVDWLLTLEKG